MTNIYLDLDTSEFDEFNLKETELWQQDAASQLIKHLTTLGLAAKQIKDCSCQSEENTSRHVHDTILISGGRGTGKSIFLYNAKKIWEKQDDKVNNKPHLYFLDPIDPTLLQDNDSFSNVIIANIFNSVHKKIQEKPQIEAKKFYDRLRNLAESIEEVDKQQLGGLDKLMHYSSGVRVQNNFYRFVKEAITLLCCDALVLPIDDVDMALGKAYDVLEEIRRRLCCPFIIPLVSGDPDLYEHLVKINFSKSIINKDFKDITNSKAECMERERKLLTDLPGAYLTKVLPHHYRITLQSIDAISSTLIIKWNNDSIPYFIVSSSETYQGNLLSFFFGPRHDDEKGRDYPWPSSSRQLGQMIRLLRPDAITSKIEDNNNYKNLLTWASARQHGACYTLALSALEFRSPCRASHLTAFNLHKQAGLDIPWAIYNFTEDQIHTIGSYRSSSIVLKANKLLIEHSLRSNVLRSMPPIELHLDKMSITKDNIEKEQYPFLLAIYTYNAYYGTQGNKQLKIYFSKAFEILSTSILNANYFSEEIRDSTNIFEEILNQAPFYSVYNLSPTKQVDEEKQSEEDESSVYSITVSECEHFIKKLDKWNEEHHDKISTLFANSAQLISLLSAVFNKSFTQISYLRKEFDPSKGDELVDLVLRFKYIILNAFGFFLKENGIRIASNIAIEAEKITLRDESKFKNTPTYKGNVEWINEKGNEKYKEFIDAIENHPIFVKLDDKKSSAKITTQSNSGQSIKDKATSKTKSPREKFRPSYDLQKRALKSFNELFNEDGFNNYKSLMKYISTEEFDKNKYIKEKSEQLFNEFRTLLGDIDKLYKTTDLAKLYLVLGIKLNQGKLDA